jgi:hypothetical protein
VKPGRVGEQGVDERLARSPLLDALREHRSTFRTGLPNWRGA